MITLVQVAPGGAELFSAGRSPGLQPLTWRERLAVPGGRTTCPLLCNSPPDDRSRKLHHRLDRSQPSLH